jgi:hypothetical protein
MRLTRLAVVAAVVAASACTPAGSPASTEPPGGGALVEAGPMPPVPPDVLVEGEPVPPLAAHWIVEGTVRQLGPTGAADLGRLEVAEVPAPVDGRASVEIRHPTLPPTMYVTLFDRLDERGHPAGPGRRVDCTVTSSACSVRRDVDRLRLEVRTEPWTRLLVLQVAYTVWPEDARGVPAAPDLVTASWGACLVPDAPVSDS